MTTNEIQNIFAMREYMAHQKDIRLVSVAQNGVIKIVYNAERVGVGEAETRMEALGVRNFRTEFDSLSCSVFVTIRNN
jgi:hypothetical protein